MRRIELSPDRLKPLVERATRFRDFRLACVEYLERRGIHVDKFTVTGNDRLIGFVAEHVLADDLPKLYPGCVLSTKLWYQREEIDVKQVKRIIDNDDCTQESVQVVREYFYDAWDLEIETPGGTVQCDVKTAITQGKPNLGWVFLYPVVQASRGRPEDTVLLAWCLAQDENDPNTITDLMLVGVTTKAVIRARKIILKGERSQKGVTSQIDNYQTEVRHDYQDLVAYWCPTTSRRR